MMDIFIKNESTFARAPLEVRSFVDVNIWVHTTVTAQYFTPWVLLAEEANDKIYSLQYLPISKYSVVFI